MSNEKPTVGQILHYHQGQKGEERAFPAVVTAVSDDGKADLYVFADGAPFFVPGTSAYDPGPNPDKPHGKNGAWERPAK